MRCKINFLTTYLIAFTLAASVFSMEEKIPGQIKSREGATVEIQLECQKKYDPFGDVRVYLLKEKHGTKIGEMEVRFDRDFGNKIVILNLRNHTIDSFGNKKLTGIGSYLVNVAKYLAKIGSYSAIFVSTWSSHMVPKPQPQTNDPTKFFEKMGFKVIKVCPTGSDMDYAVEVD